MTIHRKKAGWIVFLLVAGVFSQCMFSRTPRLDLEWASQHLKPDFESELRRRKIEKDFQSYKRYVSEKVAETGKSDKFRLSWIEALVREPLDAPQRAEKFTRNLFSLTSETNPHRKILEEVAAKLDVPPLSVSPSEPQPGNALTILSQAIHRSRQSVTKAFRSLSTDEQKELGERIYSESTEQVTYGYRFGGKDRGVRLVDLLTRMDRSEILNAGRQLAALTDPAFLKRLKRSQTGNVETADGLIVIGGEGSDFYDLDRLPNVCAIVDFGGDDVYVEGAVTPARPVFVILDFSGNDLYRGKKPGIQGAAIMGASLLLDRSGNDTYTAGDVAQGSALAGIGMLIDHAGNDSYLGDRRIQAQAVSGFGMLFDREGDDRYRGALLAQGVGGPLGFGLLVDRMGEDHYFAGGKYQDTYEDSPGFGGWSQGIGAGARDVANGGVGVLLDGTGRDIYEADYFSHGGGYWFGAGFARDFEGDDQRWGAVRENFDGSPRSEVRFLRWGIGFGCHYAAGFVFDDRGNDSYEGDWASIAYAWDVAIGALFDGDGDDRYLSRGSGVAEARNHAFAVLYDARGTDRYIGKGLGQADGKTGEKSIISFALLQDRAGEDTFSFPFTNHSKAQRGWAGGFLIDR